jgi:hypothetical protein
MKRLVCVALVAAVAGCGESTIDSGKLEADIEEDAQAQGLVLDSVDCPSPEVEEGKRFACTVTVKGERRELEVVQRAGEAVGYDLDPLLDFTSGSDAGGDEAAVRFVVDAVNTDVTALCDYATNRYRRKIVRQARGRSCARAVIAKYDRPLREYEVSVEGDSATAGAGEREVRLERQRDGSWLIAGVR